MLHRIITAALTAAAVLALGACASAPHLSSSQLRHVRRAQVYIVKPQDGMQVVTSKGDVAKAITSTALFGLIGLSAYIGVKSSDKADVGFEAQRRYELMQQQHWPVRIEAAVRAALAQSPEFASATVTVLADMPEYGDVKAVAAESDADSVLFIAPELDVTSTADRVSLTLRVYLYRHEHPARCNSCGYVDMNGADQVFGVDDQVLRVDQDLQTLGAGKTWAEQQEAGHRRHALTLEQYVGFWFSGEPLHLAAFLDPAIPAAQQDLLFYLTGEGAPAAALPPQQWVIQ